MERNTFDNIFNNINPVQKPDELYWLVNEVEKTNPTVILEIGVEFGGTLLFWDYILKENGLLIGIDIQNILKWDITKSKNDIKFIMQDSTKKDTINKVEHILNKRDIDFLFIDGGHTEDVVISDYQEYSKFVRKRGIIAFHDVHLNEVKRLWEKIDKPKELYTIKDHGMGIGIVRM